jgi:hypothetical protein
VPGPDWGSSAWTLVNGTTGGWWADDTSIYITHRLRLTDNNTGRNGSAWLNSTQIAPQQDWTASYRAQLTYPNAFGSADGMGMVFQTQGTGVNSAPPGAYYSSFTAPSLAVDVCTYDPDRGGVNHNAMRVFENGTQIASWSLGTNVNDTVYYNLFATYTAATHNLAVRYQGDGLDQTENVNVDLGALFGSQAATFGYTAATGAGAVNHDILDGALSGTIPEPATMSVLALGGLALLRRRKSA